MYKQDRHALHFDESGKLKITGNWICSMGQKIEVKKMKMAAKYHGCSITHLIAAGIGAGMERYFAKYHSQNNKMGMPEGINYIVPLPIPGHPNMRLTNHWTFTKIHAKFGIGTTSERLEYFQKETRYRSHSTLPIVTAFIFQYISGLLPTPLDKLWGGIQAFTICLSNLVGPQDRRLFAGGDITDMFFFMPISQESMALGIGIISCNGGLRICTTADTGCVPDRIHLKDLSLMMDEEILNILDISKMA